MKKKLPILYYRPGKIVDSSVVNWIESDIYTISDLKKEITGLEFNELVNFITELMLEDIVNVDILLEVIGSFEEVGDSIFYCSLPYNKNILHCTIYYTNDNNFKVANSISFYFKDKLPLFDNDGLKNVKVETRHIDKTLSVTLIYPLFNSKKNRYMNQIIFNYSFNR